MINFTDYDITIAIWAIHPKGLDCVTNIPFMVRQVEFTQPWGEERTKEIKEWCEYHKGQTLAIHEMTSTNIRYAILHRDAT